MAVEVVVGTSARDEPPEPVPATGSPRAAVVAVGIVLVVCAVLRASLPTRTCPGNTTGTRSPTWVSGRRCRTSWRSSDPGFYDYPAFVFLTQAIVLVLAKVAGYDPEVDGEILDVQGQAVAHAVDHVGLLRAIR